MLHFYAYDKTVLLLQWHFEGIKIAWNTGYLAYNVICLHSLYFDSMQLHVCMQYGLNVCEFLLNVNTHHFHCATPWTADKSSKKDIAL